MRQAAVGVEVDVADGVGGGQEAACRVRDEDELRVVRTEPLLVWLVVVPQACRVQSCKQKVSTNINLRMLGLNCGVLFLSLIHI